MSSLDYVLLKHTWNKIMCKPEMLKGKRAHKLCNKKQTNQQIKRMEAIKWAK
jgi:hypothetical protein